MLTSAARRHLGWLSCCLALVLSAGVGCNEKKAKPKSDAKAVAKAEKEKLEQAKAKAAEEEKAKAAAKKKAEQLPPIGSKSMIATPPKDRKRTEGFSTSVQGREGFGNSEWQAGLGSSNSSGMSGGGAMGLGSDSAFDRVEAEIRAAAGDRKTLVVYICDQAASQMVNRLADRASRLLKGSGTASTIQQNLSAAVVSFGDDVKVVTPSPVNDSASLAKALNEVKGNSPPGKLAYKAVATAADTFGKFRNQDYEVLFVMLADEAAPDEEALKTALAKLKRDNIPVYAFGTPQPFFSKDLKISAGKPAGASWGVEHITVYTPAKLNDADYVDSGYGNFGLERITRLTEGKFFRSRGRTSTGWATDANGDIKPELIRKYAPEYISEAEYKAKAEENKARNALLEASKLVIDAQFEPPVMTFLAGDDENQARFATAITAAQRKAAAPQQEFEKILTVLQAGEADRGKLGSPRWEAAYDLALGRAYAALARTLGYNKMLAQVKQGKAFTKPTSNTWELVSSPNFAGDSQLNTMAKKSREYLTRVVEQHPGTPWADIASKELMSDCGWDWEER
jgi:hypothetical protein